MKSAVKLVAEPPAEEELRPECRACGQPRAIDEYRVFSTRPFLRVDFCVLCERKDGTAAMYQRYANYGDPAIRAAVFEAAATQPALRTELQTRAVVEPGVTKLPENNEELVNRELARRDLSKRRLVYYIHEFKPDYKTGWVHHDICRRLERFMLQVEQKKSPRLMMFMQPRIGKSLHVSDMFPSWLLGHHPDWPIIASSYAQSLPLEFSRAIRDRLEDQEHKAIFPEARLRSDAKGIEAWKTTKGGGYTAAGIGTGITGKGFMCLPGSERIMTERGWLPIGVFCGLGDRPRVMSYSHRYSRFEWARVLAVHEGTKDDFVEFTTRSGRQLRATADHRVFVAGLGYVEAAVLEVGARVIVQGDVRDVRRTHEGSCVQGVPYVFRPGSLSESGAGLFTLQGCFSSPAIPGQKGAGFGLLGRVLLNSLFHRASRGEERQAVQGVRRVNAWQALRMVFGRMQAAYAANASGAAATGLLGMHGVFPPHESAACLLRQALRGSFARGTDAWSRQPAVRGWEQLRRVVRRLSGVGIGAGRALLRCLSVSSSAAGTPHRHGHTEQSGCEPGDALYDAPPPVPRDGTEEITFVARVRSEGERVYDIQVEGNCNFVAEGILVHNCGIVDDPIKDDEEAQSDTVRNAAHNWYLKVFRTRAAPGAGILFVNCMVGGTAVLMADGSEKALRDVKIGDAVATYEGGALSASIVRNWVNHGPDDVYEIKTISGTTVMANGRHPFLVDRGAGVTEWVRTSMLQAGDRVLRATAVNGAESSAQSTAATTPFRARATAFPTTTKLGGLAGIGRRLLSILQKCGSAIFGIGTASTPSSTTPSSPSSAGAAPYADSCQKASPCPADAPSCTLTIATTPARSEGYSATTATSSSAPVKLRKSCGGPLSTYELVPDAIIEIAAVGREDVFDIEVERTENFIANGLVSHNTRWHHDDPVGRLLDAEAALEKEGVPPEERENWEVVSYPAIAEEDEHLLVDGTIGLGDIEPSAIRRTLRRAGEVLHPERYSYADMVKVKNSLTAADWSALYQQRPTPSEGDFFKRDDFVYRWLPPDYLALCRTFMTVDYAIKKGQRKDYTVAGVFALDFADNLYVIAMRRGRWGTNEIVDNIVALAETHKPELYAGERGQLHEAVWPIIDQALEAKRIYLPVDESLVPMQDKLVRARPLQGRMQRKKLMFSYDATTRPDIYDKAERELLQFPDGAHDDIVDCLAWAARLALNLSLPTGTSPPKRKSWKDKLNKLAVTHDSSNHMAA